MGEGRKTSLAAPNRPLVGCGIELELVKGTVIICFLPSVTPFRTAVITSLALPTPTPTLPCSFPTTIIARKLIFFPPFTTLVTRSIATTRSDHSDLDLIVLLGPIQNF